MYACEQERKPEVFSSTNFVIAAVLHLLLFGVFWMFGLFKPDPAEDETIIPIDCVVVVHENLDGVENEPPPMEDPPDQPEPPPPDPPVETPPPPTPPPPAQDAVIVEQTPPEPPKPPEVKPPEPPKPSAAEIKRQKEAEKKAREEARQKQLDDMRKSMTKLPTTERNNGRTEKRPENYRELLNKGYRPGAINAGLDASEEQRCNSLIMRAFYEKWEPRPPWSYDLRNMKLEVTFDMAGHVRSRRLVGSSGNVAADQTVINAANRVQTVSGLTRAFLEKHRTVTIEFEVTKN